LDVLAGTKTDIQVCNP